MTDNINVQMIGFELVKEISESYLHHALLYSCSQVPPQALTLFLDCQNLCTDQELFFPDE